MKKAIAIIAASVMAAVCIGGCSNAGYMPGYSDTPQSTRPDEVSTPKRQRRAPLLR